MTAPNRSRIARGRATQHMAAAWYRENGFPYATAKDGSAAGQDLDNMVGLSGEVKATDDVPLLAALRQAEGNANGALPFVLWRPNGYGPERIHKWVMAFWNEDGTRLLRDAGYGDPIDAGGG